MHTSVQPLLLPRLSPLRSPLVLHSPGVQAAASRFNLMQLPMLFRNEAHVNLAISVPPNVQLGLPVDRRLGLMCLSSLLNGLFVVHAPR